MTAYERQLRKRFFISGKKQKISLMNDYFADFIDDVVLLENTPA